MIKHVTGDITKAGADALVNTVNCIGVMGKGVALQFRKAFPWNNKPYRKWCSSGRAGPGAIFVSQNPDAGGAPRFIINAATKHHWMYPSRYVWVEAILGKIDAWVASLPPGSIDSIAIPRLGCGNGGLDWEIVRPKIESMAQKWDGLEVLIVSPA